MELWVTEPHTLLKSTISGGGDEARSSPFAALQSNGSSRPPALNGRVQFATMLQSEVNGVTVSGCNNGLEFRVVRLDEVKKASG